MSDISARNEDFARRVRRVLGERLEGLEEVRGQLIARVAPANWLEASRLLRDEESLQMDTLIDLCGVDYLGYGDDEWETAEATGTGFSRGVDHLGPGRFDWASRPEAENIENRFAVVAQLLSTVHNRRLRLRGHPEQVDFPTMPSLVELWSGANWFEREAFDLFGIVFEGHPDLRRIMTDYGFIGHPFRKDFPLVGNVTVRYDEQRQRVVYEPTEIEPRVLVPRVIRRDSRYVADETAPRES